LEPTASKKTRRMARVRRVFRKRWVWACIILLVWLIAVGMAVKKLGPKPRQPGEDTTKYKYLHCSECGLEVQYTQTLDNSRCLKCVPPKTGFFVPTTESMKAGGGAALSPWMKVYVAWLVETVIMLGSLTYLLYRPIQDPTKLFFVVVCPSCNQRLRYRAVSHGGLGSCSRCKRMLRFPDEEDAVTEEAVLAADAAAAAADYDRAMAEADARAEEQLGPP
jgi:uncharacterized paraquat-inducible protein A